MPLLTSCKKQKARFICRAAIKRIARRSLYAALLLSVSLGALQNINKTKKIHIHPVNDKAEANRAQASVPHACEVPNPRQLGVRALLHTPPRKEGRVECGHVLQVNSLQLVVAHHVHFDLRW